MKTKIQKPPPQKSLTATELEMMNVIWRFGSCTVSQVQEALTPERELAWTSVSTIIRILERKGFVTSEKIGRGHLYSAVITKDAYQVLSLNHVVRQVFDDTPSLLVQRLLDSRHLTDKELAEIRALLRKKAT